MGRGRIAQYPGLHQLLHLPLIQVHLHMQRRGNIAVLL